MLTLKQCKYKANKDLVGIYSDVTLISDVILIDFFNIMIINLKRLLKSDGLIGTERLKRKAL